MEEIGFQLEPAFSPFVFVWEPAIVFGLLLVTASILLLGHPAGKKQRAGTGFFFFIGISPSYVNTYFFCDAHIFWHDGGGSRRWSRAAVRPQ